MSTIEIPLTQGLVALVDEQDAQAVCAHSWFAHRNRNGVYARRNVKRADGAWTTTGLHTFLTGWARVDHVNGDGLDNRRINLRDATNQQNGRNRGPQSNNTSGFKGVGWRKDKRKWRARINPGDRELHLGWFTTAEEAARAYDEAARELHGQFAWLNFPVEVSA